MTGRLSEDASVREIVDGLGRWEEGASPALRTWLPAIGALLDAARPMAFGIAAAPDAYTLEFMESSGFPHCATRRSRGWLQGRRRPWGALDPTLPSRTQRNRAFVFDEFAAKMQEGQQDQMRRLRLERKVARAPLDVALLYVLLERIATPGWVVRTTDGVIVYCNAGGHLRLDGDRSIRDALLRAVGPGGHPEYETSPLIASGIGDHALVVERAPPESPARRLAAARRRWSLTPRQVEVLAHLVQGHANRTIAALLKCSERTVEVHVTSLLDKAGCDGRASLVARFWREGGDGK